MPLISTPAIVLHAFPYGETSKIVRLATRDHGVQSAIAKGAARPKSKFGARLQLLSAGTAMMYLKPHRDLHTLSSYDVTRQRPRLAREVRRYAAAEALAELILRFAPAEPHPELYDLLDEGLERLGDAEKDAFPAVALTVLWCAIAALGFAPAVDACARCGEPVDGAAFFSVPEGGVLCARCARGATPQGGTRLADEHRARLSGFLRAEPGDEPIEPKAAAAHRRLLARFVRRHLSEDRSLGALEFWETLA